jgi:ribonuclease HI
MTIINVYTDGACSNNGKPNAKAGYGVWFSENDRRNEHGSVSGKQSNNTGELTGFIRAIEILEKEINEGGEIHLYTDSEYVIKCVTTYGTKLERNGWKSDKIIPNLELVKKAFVLFKGKHNIKLKHIDAHTSNDDIHSRGNSEADKLACLAIGHDGEDRKFDKKEETKLEWVSFDNKDQAKELGAKWNIKKKYWYADDSVSDENMQKLLEMKNSAKPTIPRKESGVKKYLKISYAKKDKAKSLGARWDSNVKSWYYIDEDISDDKKQELLKL